MQMVNIHKAKTYLSKLIDLALKGEEVVIAKNGVPLVRITPYEAPPKKRELGRLKGQLKIAEDFDVLPEEAIDLFEQ